MEKTLLAIVSEIAMCNTSFSELSLPIQFNLFEHSRPENLSFNGFHSLLEYYEFLAARYAKFKKLHDKHVRTSEFDASNMLFMIQELINRYYECEECGKRICFHDEVFLADKADYRQQITDIRLKLSGFLSAQKKNTGENSELCAF